MLKCHPLYSLSNTFSRIMINRNDAKYLVFNNTHKTFTAAREDVFIRKTLFFLHNIMYKLLCSLTTALFIIPNKKSVYSFRLRIMKRAVSNRLVVGGRGSAASDCHHSHG